ncbi:hypothetical protein ES703_61471 [subsurface metagenome]
MENKIGTPFFNEAILVIRTFCTFLYYPVVSRPVRIYPGGEGNFLGRVQRRAVLNKHVIIWAGEFQRSAEFTFCRPLYRAIKGTVVTITGRIGGNVARALIERPPADERRVGVEINAANYAGINQTQQRRSAEIHRPSTKIKEVK